MRRVGVTRVVLTTGPDFVQHERCGPIGRPVQIIGQAAVFFASGPDEGAEFGFEEHLLPIAWPQLDDQCHRVPCRLALAPAAGPPLAPTSARAARSSSYSRVPSCHSLRHSARDSTATASNSQSHSLGCAKRPNRRFRYFSASFRPAFRLSKFMMVFSTSEYVPRVSPR
jgi:hypothetical protein